LTIDRSCHVTGSITYSLCAPTNDIYVPDCANNQMSYQVKLSLWRSGDGTRLSGSALTACTVGPPACAGSWIAPLGIH
jgi:hypothetical protein